MKKEDFNSSSSEELDLTSAMDSKNQTRHDEGVIGDQDPKVVKGAPAKEEIKGEGIDAKWLEDDDVDPAIGLPFSPPVKVPGETLIPLKLITEFEYHPANGSRTRGDNAAGLVASAVQPANIAPIILLAAEDGLYPVLDGRLRLHAFREAHGADSDIEIRCVMFDGTVAEAVQSACDDALGCTPRSAIEIARAIYNVQRVAGVSQKEISERYSVLKKDQVNRMTIAAKVVEGFPTVFNLLEEPDRVSIDLCVQFARHMKGASEEEREKVLLNAEILESAGERLKRNELFEALEIEIEGKVSAPVKADPLAPVDSTPIIGHDDQPVGALEMLSDDVHRLRLPDPATMTFAEREEAAEAFIKQIRIYFELDAAG